MSREAHDPSDPKGEALPHGAILDENDPELVIDDGTIPVEPPRADAPFIDEEIVLEDDPDSVEVVVKLQAPQGSEGDDVAARPGRPRTEERKVARPVAVIFDEPSEAPPPPAAGGQRLPRWWVAIAAGLLLLLGAGAYVSLHTPEPAVPDIVAFRPSPPMEAIPKPIASEPAASEAAVESPHAEEAAEPAAPAPAVAVADPEEEPAIDPPAEADPSSIDRIERLLAAQTPEPPAPSSASTPDTGEEKNIETSPIAPDETIVELKNGNTFAGRLRRYDAKGAELEIWNGLIALSAEQLAGVLNPDAVDYKPIESFPMGYVQLANRNRVYGRVFKVTSSRIILAVNGARFGFHPSQVQLGYLKPGEEPPPEAGMQDEPDAIPSGIEPPGSSGPPEGDERSRDGTRDATDVLGATSVPTPAS
jgi:hypothetical protein